VKPLERYVVPPGRSIREVMRTIDQGAEAIALVVGDDGQLQGTVSDGDVRRALLAGADLDDPVDPHIGREPVTVPEETDRAAVLDLMRARRLSQIPVIDEAGRLVGLHVMQEVLGAEERGNWAVVLAGGRGTRLGTLTASTPKPMLPVAGRPILEHIVLHLVGSGIRTVFLAVNYLAEQIQDHFLDGSDLGCRIHYLEEDPARPLGTGGPLRGLLAFGQETQEPILVMNGDLITSFSVRSILEHHARTHARMTVALSEYVHDVPYGVVKLNEREPELVADLLEKPRWTGLVNAGVYVIEPDLVGDIPEGANYPITELAAACLDRGTRVAAWRLAGEWHDVGRPREFARARGDFSLQSPDQPEAGAGYA
jgi:dTDP-glucose pyrophosphorylase